MARGRKTALRIVLSPDERDILESWQRSTKIPYGRARRGRIILLMASNTPISTIAQTVGITRRFVYKWVYRFIEHGICGLRDIPRTPHTPRAAAQPRH